MNYTDIKAGQVFVEATVNPKYPNRKPRKVRIRIADRRDAEVLVIEGRGKGKVIYLYNSRLCDPEKWTLELPRACPRCKDEGHYFAPGDYAPLEDTYCSCPAAVALRARDGAPV